MQKQGHAAIMAGDTAVELVNTEKFFVQRQRGGHIKDIFKNLIKPESREIRALDNVSFTVKAGEFTAYAGPNGAGKSTTLKMLCGALAPTGGEVRALTMDPMKSRIPLMKRTGALFASRTELWWDHPVQVSFEWKRAVWDIDKASYERMLKRVVEQLDIGNILSTFARELSLGQRMRADLAMLLLHQPDLLLLDEPTLGLDVLSKRQLITFFKQLNRDEGTTIIVTSHDMDDLEEMAGRILLLSQGKLRFDGSFDMLRHAAGAGRRLILTTDSMIPPDINCVAYLKSEGSRHTYQFDEGKLTIKEALYEAAGLEGVRDIETEKAPIEEVIAGIYRELE